LFAPLLEHCGPIAIVDLETTGLPTDSSAEILEFGVLTLDLAGSDPDGGPPDLFGATPKGSAVSAARVEVRVLEGLIRPQLPLPSEIQRLTGLRDRDVADAKRLDEVRYRVAEALEGRVLIAHNADFERHFLTRQVSKEFKNTVFLDTQDLLALTHPDAPDLRLATFTRLLLEREERHRALADALDTARVMAAIALGAELAEERYLVARRALDRYAPDSPWLQLLRGPLIVDPDTAPDQFIRIAASDHEPVRFDEDAIAAVLADGERGQAYFPGYRVREEQIELARHFVRNFKDHGTLLLEGGTGVGKSLAYLAAAIPFAIERRRRGLRGPVVISTRTKLLQDQLLRKDIAAAARFLGYPELRALSIKGRANYVCERRLGQVLDEGRDVGAFPEEKHAYAVLLACARTRPYAEIGDLPGALLRRYPILRDLRSRSVARRAEQCSREECAKTTGCPFGARRSALASADLVVANHDLLLRWPNDYPNFTHVIADEAHEVAGVADDVYAQLVSPDEVLERIDDIFGRPSDRGETPLLPLELRKQVAIDVVEWRREIDLDFMGLGKAVTGRASEYGELQLPANPDRAFPEAAEFARLAAQHIDAVAREAELLALRRDNIGVAIYGDGPSARDERDDDGEDPLRRAIVDLRGAAEGLRTAFAGMPDYVSSFESLGRPQQRFRLLIRPVSPADAYHNGFMDPLDSFAAVSASLFVAGDAFASLGELEIDERGGEKVRRVTVESPFPYAENMRVVALKPVDDATSETAAVLAILAEQLGGRTLGLFTSLKRMHEVAALLDTALEGTGIEILTPRFAVDDPAALVQRFANSRRGAVLLGARTFWQGVDLPGDVLQAVVIEKLPFEVPTELRKRRELRIRETGGDPFNRQSLGKMLLHLKQMSGRLIRSETDHGITVIVDARTDRRYFRRLRDAFPRDTRIQVIRRHQLPSILAEIQLGRESTG
jgi:Rad3-related DNA helicase/DNA polymerase III epsilon subunit-like protein